LLSAPIVPLCATSPARRLDDAGLVQLAEIGAAAARHEATTEVGAAELAKLFAQAIVNQTRIAERDVYGLDRSSLSLRERAESLMKKLITGAMLAGVSVSSHYPLPPPASSSPHGSAHSSDSQKSTAAAEADTHLATDSGVATSRGQGVARTLGMSTCLPECPASTAVRGDAGCPSASSSSLSGIPSVPRCTVLLMVPFGAHGCAAFAALLAFTLQNLTSTLSQ
jgi:hypothetical protein